MSKRKTAHAPKPKPQAPQRRYLLVSAETGQEVGGSHPSKPVEERGIAGLERAESKAGRYAIKPLIKPAWEHYGYPDPEAADA